ncbi:MAG: trigger factor [Candidatus Promineifilaceae bacterium]
MALKINTQEDDKRQLNVTIEVESKRINKAMQKAARTYARDLNIPGFRRGKAPYGIIKGYVGEENLRQEALNDILPKVFEETLAQIDAEPFAQPTLDDVEFDPLVLKMTVPLEPTVVLGDYRTMRKEVASVEISEEAIDEALVSLQEQQATNEPVERASEASDEIVISGTAHIDGDEEDVVFSEEHFHVQLNEKDNPYNGTSFVSELIGLSAEEGKSFSITLPEEHEDDPTLAGKTVNFAITASEVLARTTPELDDAFAQEQPGEHETLESLRAATADRLQKQAESQAQNDLLEEAITEMLENIEDLVYPPGAVESEIDGMINQLKGQIDQMGWNWDAYIQSRQLSEQELRDEYEDDAVNRVERGLIMRAFVEAEKLTVTDAQVETAIDERMADYDEEMIGYMRPFFERDGGMMVRNDIMTENIHGRLLAIYAGEAPDLAEEEAETDAPETNESTEEAASADDSEPNNEEQN